MKYYKLMTILSLTACSFLVSGNASASAHTHKGLIAVPAIYRTVGPGISYPDATDPTRALPRIVQLAAACIRNRESKNHRVDGNAYGTGAGWYQFISSTWHSAAVALHFPARIQWDANKATGDEQSAVFVWYWHRNARLGVQWPGDAPYCPGVFFF
jgi:hypothetical protein